MRCDRDALPSRATRRLAQSRCGRSSLSDSSTSSAKWGSTGSDWNESTSTQPGYFPLSYGANHNFNSASQGTVAFPSQTGMMFECTLLLCYEATSEYRTTIRDAARHNLKFNAAMFDGHVETRSGEAYRQFNLNNAL